MEDAVLVVVAQNKRNDAASSLYPFVGFDVAAASLGNGCGIIRWAAPSRRWAACGRWIKAPGWRRILHAVVHFLGIKSKNQFRMGQFITRYDAFLEGDRGAA